MRLVKSDEGELALPQLGDNPRQDFVVDQQQSRKRRRLQLLERSAQAHLWELFFDGSDPGSIVVGQGNYE